MLKVNAAHIVHPVLKAPSSEARQLYFSLLNEVPNDTALARSRFYLAGQLEAAGQFDADLPRDLGALSSWIESNTRQVGHQYRQYLEARKVGDARRYFTSKSHALYFLKSVAPTKLVDGAWLYGLVNHWRDTRFSALIRTYLEELGEGVPGKNHVVVFKKLLASHGCDQWDTLSSAHYVQGAIQLSLGYHAADFLPEVIGYNLGYEQLPLHLLISAYELNELDIDPYYFTLHITVDNAASGHARKALQGLSDALPRIMDGKAFYRRVINGYNLNQLGACTNSIIDEFDLRDEMLAIFSAKCAVGARLHSDYCRVSGKTVNEWLSNPAQLPEFLNSLEQTGWIKRHQDPQNSRFWKMIQGEHAEMFGVFSSYERQIVYDWIAGDSTANPRPRQLTFKARRRLFDTLDRGTRGRQHGDAPRGVIRQHFSWPIDAAQQQNDFNMELRLLEEELASLSSREAVMAVLTKLMSPANHHTALGLMATRIFTTLFDDM